MRIFTARLELLSAAQQHLWPSLRPLASAGFVLYGGTAITLRLGHRASVDFDFFTERPLDKDNLQVTLPWLAQAVTLQDRPETLTILAQSPGVAAEAGQVKVSFLGSIRFGRVDEPEMTADQVTQVASLRHLLATKLKMILQRIEAKDYLDIDALLGAGVRLDQGLPDAQALYGPTLQPSEYLKALVYFEGGDLETLSADARARLITAASAVGPLPPSAILSTTLAVSS